MVHWQLEYIVIIVCSTLKNLFFAGSGANFGTQQAAGPPPSIETDTDHSQPVPEDDELDSRPDQAAMEATIADFLIRPSPMMRSMHLRYRVN